MGVATLESNNPRHGFSMPFTFWLVHGQWLAFACFASCGLWANRANQRQEQQANTFDSNIYSDIMLSLRVQQPKTTVLWWTNVNQSKKDTVKKEDLLRGRCIPQNSKSTLTSGRFLFVSNIVSCIVQYHKPLRWPAPGNYYGSKLDEPLSPGGKKLIL